MAAPPSSALAGAAVSAQALSGVLAGLARTLPAPTASARGALATARRLRFIAAPRIVTAAQAGAVAGVLVTALQALARDCPPADAAAGLYAAAGATRACAPTSASPALTQAYALARALCVSLEAACLGEAFLAEARTDFADRQSATAARARIAVAMDGASDRIAAALGQPALEVLGTAARQTTAFLVAGASTLRPVARITAPGSRPSTALAWALYRDPTRAENLVARNRCGTPFHMPATFEALTPEAQ